MRQARPLRFLQPMTMADILRPQLNLDSDERRKALQKSWGRRRRFMAFVILSSIYASSGISIAAVVVPGVVKQISHAVRGGPGGGTDADDGGQYLDDSDAAAADSTVPTASAYSSSSSGSSRGSGSSGDGYAGGAAENAVPEPSSVILLAIGSVALCAEALRRKRAGQYR